MRRDHQVQSRIRCACTFILMVCAYCLLSACFTIGGTVTGLSGTGLTLQNGTFDSVTVAANGPFTFAKPVFRGMKYDITISATPANQTCPVTKGTGRVADNVRDILVNCENLVPVPPSAVVPTDSVNGISPGLASGSLSMSADGAAMYRIPLFTPTGRRGVEPHLALVYNSNGGNGILGVGWSLEGLSTIVRCKRDVARDGQNAPVRFDATDAFCLDGARLVAVPGADATNNTPGSYGVAGTEYRTEDNGFARIISGAASDATSVDALGPVWFEIQTKDGLRFFYGTTPDSRLEGQRIHATLTDATAGVKVDLAQRVRLRWALAEIRDWYGNNLTIRYTTDGDAASSLGYEQLPSEIHYTGTVDGTLPALRTVKFEYELRCDSSVQDCGSASQCAPPVARCDDVTTFVSGLRLQMRHRLKKISMQAPNPTDPGIVRYFLLNYRQSVSSSHSLLGTLSECDAFDTCLPPLQFSYSQAGETFRDFDTGIHDATAQGESSPPVGPALGPIEVGDLNGDGCDDFIFSALDSQPTATLAVFAGYRLSSCFDAILAGSAPFSSPSQQLSPPDPTQPSANLPLYTFLPERSCAYALPVYAQCTFNELLAVDLDLDGRVDLLEYFISAGFVYDPQNGNGSEFTSVGTQLSLASSLNPSSWSVANGLFVGSATLSQISLTTLPTWFYGPIAPFYRSIYIGDINGDGFPDLIRLIPSDPSQPIPAGWTYQLNRGRTFLNADYNYHCGAFGTPCLSLDVESALAPGSVPTTGIANVFVFDVDGDGTADILLRNPALPSAYAAYSLSVDGQLRKPLDIGLAAGDTYPQPRRDWFVDFNADGLADCVSIPTAGPAPLPFVNADALPDTVGVGGKPLISLNTGSGFLPPSETSPSVLPPSDGNVVVDFSGNGQQSLVFGVDGTLWNLTVGDDGSVITRPLMTDDNKPIPFGTQLHVLDANGDGKADLIQIVAGAIHVYVREGPRQDLLTSVNDHGSKVTLEYAPITSANVYHTTQPPGVSQSTRDTSAGSSAILNRGPWVIARATLTSGGSPTHAYSFGYADARKDLRGRGWLGFGATRSTDLQTGVTRLRSFDNVSHAGGGYPFAGRPYMDNTAVELWASQIAHESAIDTHYQFTSLSNGSRSVVLPDSVERLEFEGTARLTVDWLVQPSGDPGGFDLSIDGVRYAANVRYGGTTGGQPLNAGSHLIAATAAPGTDSSRYSVSYGGDCDSHGHISLAPGDNKRCSVTSTGAEDVQCYVFDDADMAQMGPSSATYFSGRKRDAGEACIPDSGPFGFCRRWVGRCYTVNTNTPVYFHVFNDPLIYVDADALPGQLSEPNDGGMDAAVYIRSGPQPSACIPDGSPNALPEGICRRRFGRAVTQDGRPVSCSIFDDGNAAAVGPADSFFVPNSVPEGGQICTGSPSNPVCRRWFGSCRAW